MNHLFNNLKEKNNQLDTESLKWANKIYPKTKFSLSFKEAELPIEFYNIQKPKKSNYGNLYKRKKSKKKQKERNYKYNTIWLFH